MQREEGGTLGRMGISVQAVVRPLPSLTVGRAFMQPGGCRLCTPSLERLASGAASKDAALWKAGD